MKEKQKAGRSIEIEKDLYVLLQRCAEIEEKKIGDVIRSLLLPELQKYSHNSLEEWEQAEESMEMNKIVRDFTESAGFDPNHIPFDLQILGLRRKLDEIDRQIQTSVQPNLELEKLRFSIIEELNFAEQDALKKQQDERAKKILQWKEACRKFPL